MLILKYYCKYFHIFIYLNQLLKISVLSIFRKHCLHIYLYTHSFSFSLSYFLSLNLSPTLPLLLLPLLFDASTMLNRENRTLKWMPAAGREQLFRGHFPTLLHNAACNFQFGLAKFLDKLLLMSPQRGSTHRHKGESGRHRGQNLYSGRNQAQHGTKDEEQ